MTRLVDDLLEVSRISRGNIRVRIEPIDLVPLIRHLADEQRGSIEQSGCTLELHLPESLSIAADSTRLRQVLENLVHNACKFTEPGGRITITARREAGERTATISVRDTGIGLAEESLTRVFQSFSQVETSLDRSRGGLGLGLALVKGLVELQGGTVAASSAGLGRGSEFTVKLPIADGVGASSSRAPATPESRHRSSFRVLLVEDSRSIAEMFSLLLRQMGHEVEVVLNAAAALDRIPNGRPQIVFSDISMPGMSGYEFAREVRRRRDWDDLVLIAVTGYGQPADRERALPAGFDYHLVKPADIEKLDALFETIAECAVCERAAPPKSPESAPRCPDRGGEDSRRVEAIRRLPG